MCGYEFGLGTQLEEHILREHQDVKSRIENVFVSVGNFESILDDVDQKLMTVDEIKQEIDMEPTTLQEPDFRNTVQSSGFSSVFVNEVNDEMYGSELVEVKIDDSNSKSPKDRPIKAHRITNTVTKTPQIDPNKYYCDMCPFNEVNFTLKVDLMKHMRGHSTPKTLKSCPICSEMTQNVMKHPTRPFKSPIMAGGLFAISARFFWELGGYDDGLDIWGGEQYELSFKIWQCGGEMYDAPCSRVGHIYRGGGVPQPTGRRGDFLHKNYKRVAEVWMDEYKEYLYQRNPEKYLSIDAGNLTEQKAIREKLQCKSFKWFMEEIAFDLPKKYPLVEPPDFASGVIQSESHPNLCVDSLNHGIGQEFGLYTCAENHKRPQLNQFFVLSWHKDIRVHGTTKCWDVSTSYTNAPIIFYNCHGKKGNQLWKYNIEKKWVQHNDRCLDFDAKTMKIFVNQCDANNPNMTWNFGFVNATALHQFDQINT
ncbi:N-acetylgalactosaminyltransferase 6-like [Contarinia nasturtii]|uniref:N-acetylgalactosaminyltransferase 6-like n=1 Tax=Contarinia nasturtii TaxID=265458 RepID=UPI0012D3CC87|nr:N-acetylgalactosaminyltransferase 6-like [Contarinia nasturtii]